MSATLTTVDGTALAGRDYRAVATTVGFGDGDTEPRRVDVPVVQDHVDEPDAPCG